MKENKQKMEIKQEVPVWTFQMGLRSGMWERRLEVFPKKKVFKMQFILN